MLPGLTSATVRAGVPDRLPRRIRRTRSSFPQQPDSSIRPAHDARGRVHTGCRVPAKARLLQIPPTRLERTLSATSAAVSVRRTLGPRRRPTNPAARTHSTSRGARPPSGPTSRHIIPSGRTISEIDDAACGEEKNPGPTPGRDSHVSRSSTPLKSDTRVRPDCCASCTATARQWATWRSALAGSSFTMVRSQSTGLIAHTSSSIAFWTTRSIRLPFADLLSELDAGHRLEIDGTMGADVALHPAAGGVSDRRSVFAASSVEDDERVAGPEPQHPRHVMARSLGQGDLRRWRAVDRRADAGFVSSSCRVCAFPCPASNDVVQQWNHAWRKIGSRCPHSALVRCRRL